MPTKKTATKGGKKAPAKSAKPATKAAKAAGAKKAPAKAAAKKSEGGKAKAPATKASHAKGSNGADAKAVKEKETRPAAAAKSGATARDGAASAAPAAKKDGAKKAKSGESQRGKPVIPWAQRFKDDAPGPWTCPKCGALPQRAQPLYGEDERHHCPNLDCDQIVTLLSKEDLEPAEKRGSWPPQRNKNRAIPAAGGGAPAAPPPAANGGED